MSSARRRRGAESERVVASFMREHGWPYAEPVGGGRAGVDVTGTPGLALEVRSRRGLDLPGWLRDTASRDGLPVLVVRGDGQGVQTVGAWAAIVPLERLVEILRAAGYGDDPEPEEPPCRHEFLDPELTAETPCDLGCGTSYGEASR